MILLSGGFDPLHIGHLDYINAARTYGKVVIALNSDQWLLKKKGFVFMAWNERRRILKNLVLIHDVIPVEDEDGTICEALRDVKPNYFGNGGDKVESHPKEHEVCVELGIRELFGLGGGKIRSSSELISDAKS